MEDQQIVELYLQRDESALTQTEQKYSKYCRSIALRILNDLQDTDETLNDTWLAAWNCIPPHIPKCLQTFLGRLTRNISLKRVRSDTAMKRGLGEVKYVFEEVADWLAESQDIEREITEKELADAINTFLDSISDTERNVFVRRYWYVQSISEISNAHGFSESKVKSMLFRIRKRLYSKLKEEELI